VTEFKSLPITITANRIEGTTKTHVRLEVPDDPVGCMPTDFYKVLDMSGSMGNRATAPKVVKAGEAEEVTTLLSRNDCAVHATRALIGCASATDRVAILGFDDNVVEYLPLTPMTAAGKAQANTQISTIRPRGGTSFWAGLKAALAMLEKNYSPDRNSVIIFNTDGESDPTYNPTGTTITGALRTWKDVHPNIKFTIHTVGYGYGDALQMDLLREIAEIGGGTNVYVPDGDMLAQNMLHLYANLKTCTHTNVVVKAGTHRIPVHFLQGGQPRDFIVEGTGPFSVTWLDKEVIADVGDEPLEEAADALALDLFIGALQNGLEKKHLDFNALAAQMLAIGSTPFIRALISDLTHPDKYKGQIGKAFSRENFNRWGDYYVGGVLSGHRNQIKVNFKDVGGEFYGGTTTRRLVSNSVEIYDKLPAIKASFTSVSDVTGIASASSYVSPQSQGGGGCFTGETLVRMDKGVILQMNRIRPGDVVLGGHIVKCVVRYKIDVPQPIVRFGAAGLTEFHPILQKDWVHPRSVALIELVDIDYVYNIVLESGHTLSLPIALDSPNSTIACSLAHDFEGPVISHSYFGKKVAGLPHILEDLALTQGWVNGYVCLKNVQEVRNVNGEIEQMFATEDM